MNAAAIFFNYDLILDCTDHPSSRYLISDFAVKLGKPLISASALQTEGQLMVLNNPPLSPGNMNGGPCYRCIFPKSPPPETITSCADGGILGPVVGLIGVLQALEAIKLLTEDRSRINDKAMPQAPSLLLFSAYGSPQFRWMKLRKRSPKCLACGSVRASSMQRHEPDLIDYSRFCRSVYRTQLPPNQRMSVEDYKKIQNQAGKDHILVDVREHVPFSIANLKGSINVPFSSFESGEALKKDWLPDASSDTSIYLICRLGSDSQVALEMMQKSGLSNGGRRLIKDIKGGFSAWRNEVDREWPDI
jgi:adenylyltransferase/sulfurtransferase